MNPGAVSPDRPRGLTHPGGIDRSRCGLRSRTDRVRTTGPTGRQSQYTCSAWGWAVDPDDRNAVVTVRVLVDGVELRRGPADDFRQDLLDTRDQSDRQGLVRVRAVGRRHEGRLAHDRGRGARRGHDRHVGPDQPDATADHLPRVRLVRLRALREGPGDRRDATADANDRKRRLQPGLVAGRQDASRTIVALADPSGVHGARSSIGITTVANGRTMTVKGTYGGNDATWSRDGKSLLFDRVTAGDRSIYSIPASGGTRRLIRRDAVSADLSPTGRRIVVPPAELEPDHDRRCQGSPSGGRGQAADQGQSGRGLLRRQPGLVAGRPLDRLRGRRPHLEGPGRLERRAPGAPGPVDGRKGHRRTSRAGRRTGDR